MAKTFIQLVNLVGVNLRRSTGSTFTSLTQNQDAVMMAAYVNQAKMKVEDAWTWDVLQKTITFPSVGGTRSYDTSSLSIVTSDPTVTTHRSRVMRDPGGKLQFWDATTNQETRLREVTREFADHMTVVNSVSVERPESVAVYQNGNGLTAYFPWPPTGVRSYRFTALVPQDDLVLTTDTLLAPYWPVVLAATALASEERGEELGQNASRWWDEYMEALESAIGQDTTGDDNVLVRV